MAFFQKAVTVEKLQLWSSGIPDKNTLGRFQFLVGRAARVTRRRYSWTRATSTPEAPWPSAATWPTS